MRYDAASSTYFVDLPAIPESPFVAYGDDAARWYGYFHGQDPYADVFKPTSTNPEMQLAYTSYAAFNGYYTTPYGFVAFGLGTPSSGIPLTGTATYNAYVAGSTLDTSYASIGGQATLQFDFGAGTLGGHFDSIYYASNGVSSSLGQYTFINTVYGVGSTNFSGSLSHPNISTLGAFDGRFTGPAAQELMARWSAPFITPGTQTPGEMFGIWVGKK